MTDNQITDPRLLRAEIEQTRAALAETAEALAGKFDVPSRVKRGARDVIERGRRDLSLWRSPAIAAVCAAGGVLVTAWLVRRRRHE